MSANRDCQIGNPAAWRTSFTPNVPVVSFNAVLLLLSPVFSCYAVAVPTREALGVVESLALPLSLSDEEGVD
jgi:hypothetical protein